MSEDRTSRQTREPTAAEPEARSQQTRPAPAEREPTEDARPEPAEAEPTPHARAEAEEVERAEAERAAGFTVKDRRWWASEEPTEETASTEDRKPAYVEELEARLKEQDDRLRETVSRHREALDELERARKRIERESQREVERHRRDFLRGFLDVLDDVDRAAEAAREQGGAVAEGIELVRRRFAAKLEEQGVRRIDPEGEPFDARYHEAASLLPAAPDQDGLVIGVMKPGYLVGDDILRPALVAVGRSSAETHA